MSDDFIPLNQSTPVQRQQQWQSQSFHHSGQQNKSWGRNQYMRGNFRNKYRNNSQRNSSYGSDSSQRNIDDYLHPSMLQDPWAYLRRRNAENQPL